MNFLDSKLYRNSKEIENIAVEYYRHSGKGITVAVLLEKGVFHRKRQTQNALKYYFRRGVLFTLANIRPQQYYPTCLKSDIIKTKFRNYTNERIGIPSSLISPYSLLAKGSAAADAAPLSQCLEYMTIHTLEDYVLPLLPEPPLYIIYDSKQRLSKTVIQS